MAVGRFGGQFGIHEQSEPRLEDHHMRPLQSEHHMHRQDFFMFSITLTAGSFRFLPRGFTIHGMAVQDPFIGGVEWIQSRETHKSGRGIFIITDKVLEREREREKNVGEREKGRGREGREGERRK